MFFRVHGTSTCIVPSLRAAFWSVGRSSKTIPGCDVLALSSLFLAWVGKKSHWFIVKLETAPPGLPVGRGGVGWGVHLLGIARQSRERYSRTEMDDPRFSSRER